jgi:hypothetical protein
LGDGVGVESWKRDGPEESLRAVKILPLNLWGSSWSFNLPVPQNFEFTEVHSASGNN